MDICLDGCCSSHTSSRHGAHRPRLRGVDGGSVILAAAFVGARCVSHDVFEALRSVARKTVFNVTFTFLRYCIFCTVSEKLNNDGNGVIQLAVES